MFALCPTRVLAVSPLSYCCAHFAIIGVSWLVPRQCIVGLVHAHGTAAPGSWKHLPLTFRESVRSVPTRVWRHEHNAKAPKTADVDVASAARHACSHTMPAWQVRSCYDGRPGALGKKMQDQMRTGFVQEQIVMRRRGDCEKVKRGELTLPFLRTIQASVGGPPFTDNVAVMLNLIFSFI